MKRHVLPLAVAIGATGLALHAQETRKAAPSHPPAARRPATPPANPHADDEKAIRTLLDAFTKAFNAGDAVGAAATYTENAIVVDESGERIEGRPAIQAQYAESFADNPGNTIDLQVDALRFLSPDAAIEMGLATITHPSQGGSPEVTRFTAVYVKQDGRWLQSAERDERSHELTPHDHLLDLEWLLGEWVNESQDAVVSTTCKWGAGGNFIDREYTLKTKGQPVLTGTQRIGWDPLKRKFKTWIFDSEGGHAEGYWTHNGNRWINKIEGVSQNGLPSSATNIVTRLGKDRMSWQSVDRTLGGFAIDGIDEFIVVRKPPEASKE